MDPNLGLPLQPPLNFDSLAPLHVTSIIQVIADKSCAELVLYVCE